MKFTYTPFKFLCSISLILTSMFSHAINSEIIEQQADFKIKELYHILNSRPNSSMQYRIDWFSEQFKGAKYILGALGEGADAPYDQYPKYRVDGFDCDTYVNTVLALATANSLKTFQQCINFNRYTNGKISYINRNHFTSLDWNKYNQQRGLLKDITLNITNKQKRPVALYANTLIDKPGWYAHKNIDSIRLQQRNDDLQKKRLSELKIKGSHLKAIRSQIPYIPLTALFPKDDKPDDYLFSQIPNGAIIEIIRPDWNLREKIGTNLDVSHLGFAIWKNKQLFFREASSIYGSVVDVSLVDYLNDARKSPTIKGINVQVVLLQKPVSKQCHRFAND